MTEPRKVISPRPDTAGGVRDSSRSRLPEELLTEHVHRLALFSIVIGVDLVYHFAPNRPARWVWLTPGSLLATGLWIGGSFGFKAYVVNFADYTATYGAIGGAIVAMLWFYLSGLAILVGAELNAVIEHASRAEPHGLA